MPANSRLFESLEARVYLSAYGAGDLDTSSVMMGAVLVNVVLLESDGSIDTNTEDWTASEIAQVKGEIIEGAQWWEDTLANEFPQYAGDLSFSIDFTYADNPVPTGLEPINRTLADEELWVRDYLDFVDAPADADTFNRMIAWDDASRDALGMDWAYTAFVIDSSNDLDGKFADDTFFAWAYIGGPHLNMTYDNEGWGIENMGQVFAHETGHIFFALDEYPGYWDYTKFSGYYNTQNLNAYDLNPLPELRVASIMAEATKQAIAYPNHTSSPSSLAMLGWQDSDGDGVFDFLDVPLELYGYGHHDTLQGVYHFDGHSVVGLLPNLNPYVQVKNGITFNTVDELQYRIDSGVAVGTLTPSRTYTEVGVYEVTLQVVDSDGNIGQDTVTIEVVDPSDAADLPFNEDFTDADTDFRMIRGEWVIENGLLTAAGEDDSIAIVPVGRMLPNEFTVSATATAAAGGRYLNAFIIFDYIGPDDFKFAGVYAGQDKWAIGYKDTEGWHELAYVRDSSITFNQSYDLDVSVSGPDVQLYADGQRWVSYSFSDDATQGSVGVGSTGAVAVFDAFAITEPSPPDTSLPADGPVPVSGAWSYLNGVYTGQSADDAIAVFDPGYTATEMTLSAALTAETGGEALNAFIVFDYVSATDFKFAGMFAGQDRWTIGYRDTAGWHKAASLVQSAMNVGQTYNIDVVIDGADVRLYAGGVFKVAHTFQGPASDGLVGFCTMFAVGSFSALSITVPAAFQPLLAIGFNTPAPVPLDDLTTVSGEWVATPSGYRGQSSDDAVALFGTVDNPSEMTLSATLTAESGGDALNAFIIFDYVSPTNFKFAGMFAGQYKWTIGYRDSGGWHKATILREYSMNVDQAYDMDVALKGSDVVLYVEGQQKVSWSFGSDVTDGAVGLGTMLAVGLFEGFSVDTPYVPPAEFSVTAGPDQIVDIGQIVSFAGTVSGEPPFNVVWDFGDAPDTGWITVDTYGTHEVPNISIDIDLSGIALGPHTLEMRTIDTSVGVFSNILGFSLTVD